VSTTTAEITPLRGPAIERMNIAYMAVAMRDPNEVHTEDEVARKTGVPQVIAHGTFPLGYAGALLTRTFGADAVERFSLKLTAPVFPRDHLTAQARTRDASDDRLELDLEVVKDDGTVVARGSATVRS
jgi:acyl dehydratase